MNDEKETSSNEEEDNASLEDQSAAFNTGLQRGEDDKDSSVGTLDFSEKSEKEEAAQERGYEAGKTADANADANEERSEEADGDDDDD